MRRVIPIALLFSLQPRLAAAGEEGIPGMPGITPKRVYTVNTKESGEALQKRSGFGENEPAIRMKNLMMVGGSAFEGMEMPAHSAATPGQPEKLGRNEVRLAIDQPRAENGHRLMAIAITDAATHAPRSGLHPKVEVFMAGMDMGTQTPRVEEGEAGTYRFPVKFAMKGSWMIRVTLEGQHAELRFDDR